MSDPGSTTSSSQLNTSLLRLKLLDALRNGDKSKIDSFILELNQTKSNLQTQDLIQLKLSILHYAVQVSSLSIIQYLITNAHQFQLDINSQDAQGNTPLHIAAQSSRIDVVRYLLSLPDINDTILNKEKKQPVEVCKDLNIIQLMQFERAKFVEKSAIELRKYFTENDYTNLENLLILNPRSAELLDINGADPETGNTVLHEFIKKNDYEMCEWILNHGGDPFKRDKKGKLPIDLCPPTNERLKKLIKSASKEQTMMDPTVQSTTSDSSKLANIPVYKGYLRKWTNFASGYKLRYFVLDQHGILSYYTNQDDTMNSCRGSINLGYSTLHLDSSEKLKFEIYGKNGLRWHLKANHPIETNRWVWTLQNAITVAKDNIKKKRKQQQTNNLDSTTVTTANEIENDDPAIVEKHHHRIRIPGRKNKHSRNRSQASNESSDPIVKSENFKNENLSTSNVISGITNRASVDDQYSYYNHTDNETADFDMEDIEPGDVDDDYDSDLENNSVDLSQLNDLIATNRRSLQVELTSLIDLFHQVSAKHSAEGGAISEVTPIGLSTLNSISEIILAYNKNVDLKFLKLDQNLNRQVEVNKLWEKSIRQLENEIKERELKLQHFQGQRKQLKKYLSSGKSNGTNSPLPSHRESVSKPDGTIDHSLNQEPNIEQIKQVDEKLDHIDDGDANVSTMPGALPEELNNILGEDSDEEFFDADEFEEENERDELTRGEPDAVPETAPQEVSEAAPEVSNATPQQVPETTHDQPPIQQKPIQPQEKAFAPPLAGIVQEPTPQDNISEITKVEEDHEPIPQDFNDGFNPQQREVNQKLQTEGSFLGYEIPPRKKLSMDEDNRPKVGLWGILKSMVGKDMTRMTLPVSFNEPTSLLQRLAEDIEYNNLLNTAATYDDSTLRLVYVAAFAASEYSSTIDRIAKPFNPLLGETFEYSRPDQNYRLFVEQVSHHPPISACRAESPKWDYYGENAVDSKFYGRSFDFKHLGKMFCVIRPDNGVVDKNGQTQTEELYSWKKVNTSVVGIMLGNPTVDNYGKMIVENHTTGDSIIVDMKQRGWRASSAYQLSGQTLDKNGNPHWAMGGHWNSKIFAKQITNQTPHLTQSDRKMSVLDESTKTSTDPFSGSKFLVWQVAPRPKVPFNLTQFAITLNGLNDELKQWIAPTDTRLRPDQRDMEEGRYDSAADEKHRVEVKQREARKFREEKKQPYIPNWFTKKKHPVTGDTFWEYNGKYWPERKHHNLANSGDIF